MNVHITYKLNKSPHIEQYLESQIEKLGPRLQVFNPDMVSLRGLAEVAPKSGYIMSLNLKLPAGQMAARAQAEQLHAAIRVAFEDLTEQLGKHKDHLRSQYRFPRVRGTERSRIEPVVAFETTLASVHPEKISASDVNGFLNANLDRLLGYVERELRFRRNSGQRRLEEVSAAEVIDEVVANALDERLARPEKIALEPWLYRLSRSAMDRLANQLGSGSGARVPLEEDQRMATAEAEENMMEFYHPDESLTNESLIADLHGATPEAEASREELMERVEHALRSAPAAQREAFLLFTVEGFRLVEIAQILACTPQQAEVELRAAREHLRRSLASLAGGRGERVPVRPRTA